MEKVFSAIPYFYGATKEAPNTVRISTEMRDEVDADILRRAVGISMERYPYFKGKAVAADGEYRLYGNEKDVAVRYGSAPVLLGGAEANEHLLAFSCEGNWIHLDFFHGIADNGGMFPLLRTVLYFYCKERYDRNLDAAGIRLPGDEISAEEIEEPYPRELSKLEKPSYRAVRKAAFKLADAGLCQEKTPTAYRVSIGEGELMKFIREKDGSPAALFALLVSRAIAELHPNAELPIICGMAMNIRSVLEKPLAHHSLVSQLFLEYKREDAAYGHFLAAYLSAGDGDAAVSAGEYSVFREQQSPSV